MTGSLCVFAIPSVCAHLLPNNHPANKTSVSTVSRHQIDVEVSARH